MPKPNKKDKKASKAKAAEPQREVIHPEIKVTKCLGDKALTEDQAKELLGWEEETDEVKFGDSYLFVNSADLGGTGRKVRCHNNVNNRPLDMGRTLQYAQDLLNRRWADSRNSVEGEEPWTINGETLGISRTGRTDNCQKRLLAVVIANQLWRQDERWKDRWAEPPTMECLIVYGISEHPAVTRSIDNVQPRSLSDVLYTSGLFPKLEGKTREKFSRITDYAVRLLWHRTGAGVDAFTRFRTHSEAIDFIERHKHLLACVRHVYEENDKDRISQFISLGSAAALMYLMAASNTDGDKYREADPPSEKKMDLKLMEKAEEFWTYFAAGDPKFQCVKNALTPVIGLEPRQVDEGWNVVFSEDDSFYAGPFDSKEEAQAEIDSSGGSPLERQSTFVQAWNEFNGGALTEENVKLEYVYKDGSKRLARSYVCGGIDIGDPKELDGKDEPEDDAPQAEVVDTETTPMGKPTTPMEAAKQEAEKERNSQPVVTLSDQLKSLREDHPGLLLLFKGAEKVNAYDGDAETCSSVLHIGNRVVDGLTVASFLPKSLEKHLKTLLAAGHRVAVCEPVEGGSVKVQPVK